MAGGDDGDAGVGDGAEASPERALPVGGKALVDVVQQQEPGFADERERGAQELRLVGVEVSGEGAGIGVQARAVEGGQQTLERASEYVAGLQTKPFVISREFNAPLELVWRAWTERDRFAQWFGPKGVKVTVVKFDLRPGGMTHYHMQAPDGKLMWGRAIYREVVPPSKLVWINSFSDQDGGITRHPMTTEPWPLQLLTTITFAEKAGRTTVTVHWLPYESDETERRVFDSGRESMKLGWGGTLDQCDAYLKEN